MSFGASEQGVVDQSGFFKKCNPSLVERPKFDSPKVVTRQKSSNLRLHLAQILGSIKSEDRSLIDMTNCGIFVV